MNKSPRVLRLYLVHVDISRWDVLVTPVQSWVIMLPIAPFAKVLKLLYNNTFISNVIIFQVSKHSGVYCFGPTSLMQIMQLTSLT